MFGVFVTSKLYLLHEGGDTLFQLRVSLQLAELERLGVSMPQHGDTHSTYRASLLVFHRSLMFVMLEDYFSEQDLLF